MNIDYINVTKFDRCGNYARTLVRQQYSPIQQYIMNICDNEWKCFFSKPNVIGVGCGYKTIGCCRTREICLKVYVTKKYPSRCFSPSQLIPAVYKGIITDVVEIPPMKAKSLTERVRPVTGGYSISPSTVDSFGSYGCMVIDEDNVNYILSCNHVIADENNLPLGTPIIQPALEDHGMAPGDVIGNLTRFIPIQFQTPTTEPPNYVDCAIAKITNLQYVSPQITFLGAITAVGIPEPGMDIQKAGRTTGLTSGVIESIGTTIDVEYASGRTALFQDQVIGDIPIANGDSGSVVLNNANQAIGLLIGGEITTAVINTMSDVLIYLGVNLVTGCNY